MNEIKNITIIGSGIMGAGIAHSIFKYGLDVTLYDLNAEELKSSYNTIKSKARKKMDPHKIHMATDLETALMNCDLVIEAIYEDLQVKCELFKKIGKLADESTIFATNTSSLSITKIAQASGRPGQFLGLHFFNPPLIMRLVEMVIHEGLNPPVLQSAKTFISAIKKQAVICRDSPGFIVNRILLPVINEAFYILEKQMINRGEIETANEIDTAIVSEEILLMGPYNLADLTGIDTIFHVSNIIYEGFQKNPRYKRSPLLEKHFAAGHYGRKCGRGVYYYGNNANDPDINPPLDEKGERIVPPDTTDFDTLDLISVIINESFRVVEEGIVEDYNDIELAMELGTRWPRGPFRMAKETGLHVVLKHLIQLYEQSGNQPRYEPSSLFTGLTEDLKKFFNK
ncbi:MAG: hypothetical protein JEY91_09035 [Spirochaetaceae bacterium]|nr:hypothetical protein [Spirochaetaceae bacterium]